MTALLLLALMLGGALAIVVAERAGDWHPLRPFLAWLDRRVGDALDGAELPDADYPTSNVRYIDQSLEPWERALLDPTYDGTASAPEGAPATTAAAFGAAVRWPTCLVCGITVPAISGHHHAPSAAHIDAMWSAAYGDSGGDPTPCGYCNGNGIAGTWDRAVRCPRCGGTGNEPGAA